MKICIIFLIVTVSAVPIALSVSASREIQPDEQIQSCLRRIVVETEKGDNPERHWQTLAQIPRAKLIPQLLYFSVHASGTRKAMLPGVVISQLKINPTELAIVTVEYLDSSDSAVRRQVENWLGEVENTDRKGPPNFEVYINLLKQRRDENEKFPSGLVMHMYRRDASEALFAMAEVYGASAEEMKKLLWSDHVLREVLWREKWGFALDDEVVGRATREIQELSVHQDWWVRLYAAQMMKHATLRNPQVLDRISRDENQIVREVNEENSAEH